MIDGIKAIWNGLKWFFGILRGILEKGWAVITGLIGLLATLFAAIFTGTADFIEACGDVWDALGDSKAAMETLYSQGVPAEVLQAASYLSHFVNLQLLMSQMSVMLGVLVASAFVRMVKAWFPSVS